MLRRVVIFGISFLAGCTSQLEVLTEESNVIHIADFANNTAIEIIPDEDSTKVHVENATEQDALAIAEIAIVEEVSVENFIAEVEVNEFMPETVGVPITVEALVGQVNGRPVYANNVLAPMADQLRAESVKMNRSEFTDSIRNLLFFETEGMGGIIRGGRIYELVITELLLSEALGNMSKEQSYGVFSLLAQMRDNLASTQGGSRTQLRQSIEDESGVTTEEFLGMQRDQILIDALQNQKIWPKVNVTWRDIQREFEKLSTNTSVPTKEMDDERIEEILRSMQAGIPLKDITAANGAITLGKIRLPKEDDRIEYVTEALASGLPFQEVADSVGISESGVWGSFELGTGGIDGIGINEVFVEKLKSISYGEVVPAFEFGSGVFWIIVLDIQEPVSLYSRSIQIALRNVLRWVQFNKEKGRFIESLWGKGSLEEVKEMADRITTIAVRRYQQ
ncbi:MAG: hypothetical protein HOI88_02250 [Phycisphaerae bacterium]|jgi:hypothetical protein|nr:hypothetical protein [Phycisphaerae bacterium]MBT6283197.1 hypothetical protein [Phycisphaerae bacterium]